MRLYIVRHGDYCTVDKDPQKRLSQKGVDDSKRIAKFLSKQRILPVAIWHSDKTRSFQTAEIISKAIGVNNLTARKDLGPAEPVNKFPQEILKENGDLMIVGHIPFIQRLAGLLLANSANVDIIRFHKSSVACLEYDKYWKILWIANPGTI
jgi:phosphohistidine phosphatase